MGEMGDQVVPDLCGYRGEVGIRIPAQADVAAAFGGGNMDQRDVRIVDAAPRDAGHEGNAEARADEVPNRTGAVALQIDVRHETGRAAIAVGNGSQALAGLQGDKIVLRKIR